MPDEIIDYRGKTAVYRQLAAILRERIRSGRIAPGAVMPSEKQLEQEFGVARGTARKAVAILRDEEDLVETIAGRGTYVVDPLPSHQVP